MNRRELVGNPMLRIRSALAWATMGHAVPRAQGSRGGLVRPKESGQAHSAGRPRQKESGSQPCRQSGRRHDRSNPGCRSVVGSDGGGCLVRGTNEKRHQGLLRLTPHPLPAQDRTCADLRDVSTARHRKQPLPRQFDFGKSSPFIIFNRLRVSRDMVAQPQARIVNKSLPQKKKESKSAIHPTTARALYDFFNSRFRSKTCSSAGGTERGLSGRGRTSSIGRPTLSLRQTPSRSRPPETACCWGKR